MAALVAFALITADIRFNKMTATKATLSTVMLPFYWVTDLPSRIGVWGQENLVSRSTLQEENSRLRSAALVLQSRVQQMAALRAENMRLRALLNSSALLADDVLVAELIGISPDPARHLVVINKGADAGVFEGQPLIDSQGLMGQVIEVGSSSARVLLITDSRHAIPVQINRNGVRAIAEGMGRLDRLALRHVASTEDIEVGDLLVSSGLGGRFPVGYPVAVVTEISRDPGKAFAEVTARPSSALNRSRHVLLVFTDSSQNQLP